MGALSEGPELGRWATATGATPRRPPSARQLVPPQGRGPDVDHRLWVLGMGVLFFILSIILAAKLPGGFVRSRTSRSTVTVQLPPGATLAETDSAVQRINRELMKRQVASVYSSVGSATTSFGPGGGVRPARCAAPT